MRQSEAPIRSIAWRVSEVDFYLRAVEAGLRFELDLDALQVTLRQKGAETALVREN